jgi:hypothetical protein
MGISGSLVLLGVLFLFNWIYRVQPRMRYMQPNVAFGADFETDTGNSCSIQITVTAFHSGKLLKRSLYDNVDR